MKTGNDSESQAGLKKSFPNPSVAMCYTGLIFLLVAASEKLGFNKYEIPSINPIPWSEFFASGFIKSVIISIVFFVLYYGYQVYKSFRSNRP